MMLHTVEYRLNLEFITFVPGPAVRFICTSEALSADASGLDKIRPTVSTEASCRSFFGQIVDCNLTFVSRS